MAEAEKNSHARHLIELKAGELSQLFNSMDPSPFHDKDLDHDAEEFITSWAQEFPVREPVMLRVHLDRKPTEDPTPVIRDAVHNYFEHRAQMSRRELRRFLAEARINLAIGLVFLIACFVVRNLLPAGSEESWTGFIHESLTIAGWVAMWRPMQMYLYDWWPLVKDRRIFDKLGKMPVEVV